MSAPETGARCACKRGKQRANCPHCEGTGRVIDFRAIRVATCYRLGHDFGTPHECRAYHGGAACGLRTAIVEHRVAHCLRCGAAR